MNEYYRPEICDRCPDNRGGHCYFVACHKCTLCKFGSYSGGCPVREFTFSSLDNCEYFEYKEMLLDANAE